MSAVQQDEPKLFTNKYIEAIKGAEGKKAGEDWALANFWPKIYSAKYEKDENDRFFRQNSVYFAETLGISFRTIPRK